MLLDELKNGLTKIMDTPTDDNQVIERLVKDIKNGLAHIENDTGFMDQDYINELLLLLCYHQVMMTLMT